MAHTIQGIEGTPGPTGAVPFNESNYAANAGFESWGGRAKGGWVVRLNINLDEVGSGVNQQEVITVPGVAQGDHCELALFGDHQRLVYSCFVAADNTLKIVASNVSAGAVQPPAMNAIVRITDLT